MRIGIQKADLFLKHIPILRYLARDLGRYDGETNAEKYLVDAVADIYVDWRVGGHHSSLSLPS